MPAFRAGCGRPSGIFHSHLRASPRSVLYHRIQSFLYEDKAAGPVRILAERFYIIGNPVSYDIKKIPSYKRTRRIRGTTFFYKTKTKEILIFILPHLPKYFRGFHMIYSIIFVKIHLIFLRYIADNGCSVTAY